MIDRKKNVVDRSRTYGISRTCGIKRLLIEQGKLEEES